MVFVNMTRTLHGAGMSSPPESSLPSDLAAEMRPERIGERMRALRRALGLRPSEMADLLGIERTYWSRFEGGKRPISDHVAVLLVARFGVTLDWLILGRWDKLPFDLAEKLRAETKNN
jgi:transcriptional regulator with XRE-family HTH domain